MPSPPQHRLARRALADKGRRDRSRPSRMPGRPAWLRHGLATLAVSVLGVGVAGSVALTGSAQHSVAPVGAAVPEATLPVETSVAPGVARPSAFERREQAPSRTTARTAMTAAQRQQALDQPAAATTVDPARTSATAVEARAAALDEASDATKKRAAQLARAAKAKAAKAARTAAREKAAREKAAREKAGSPSLPLTSGYTLAARFGAVGAWSRYHTGMDLSAPIGTPVRAAQTGVVTNAGGGPASGWAGTYVTVRHPDGTTSLYAHMSQASVAVGETVTGGQVVGAVGMTGRTFGPHLHFELYPAGVAPDDVYAAVDPAPWLRALGLRF